MPKSVFSWWTVLLGLTPLMGCGGGDDVTTATPNAVGAAGSTASNTGSTIAPGPAGTAGAVGITAPTGVSGTIVGPNLDLQGASKSTDPDGLIHATVRDFRATFPDMEPAYNQPGKQNLAVDDPVFCGAALDADGKPAYAGPAGGTLSTAGMDARCKGKPCFWYWYRDYQDADPNSVLNNRKIDVPIQFTNAGGNKWVYENLAFFPIDTLGFGIESKSPAYGGVTVNRNFSFTTEIRMKFTYERGQEFTFMGDDDVFVFINGKLVINMGGIHDKQTATIKLDSLGLTPDQEYPLDFFHAERHIIGSVFRIETTIKKFVQDIY